MIDRFVTNQKILDGYIFSSLAATTGQRGTSFFIAKQRIENGKNPTLITDWLMPDASTSKIWIGYFSDKSMGVPMASRMIDDFWGGYHSTFSPIT
uniref:Uncharacterized protein n=1 Tax=Romanomermis culicivorax TaxID=13658 RepID=A0A915KXR8_ROMCU